MVQQISNILYVVLVHVLYYAAGHVVRSSITVHKHPAKAERREKTEHTFVVVIRV